MKSEEKDLRETIDNNEWKPIRNKRAVIKELQETATNTMLKDQRMNIRIGKRDLDGIKEKALEEGIPYQTLVASLIHKYVNGKLKEVTD